jgi:hypothetical protein
MAMVKKMNMYTIGSAKRFHFTAPTYRARHWDLRTGSAAMHGCCVSAEAPRPLTRLHARSHHFRLTRVNSAAVKPQAAPMKTATPIARTCVLTVRVTS